MHGSLDKRQLLTEIPERLSVAREDEIAEIIDVDDQAASPVEIISLDVDQITQFH